MKQFTTCLLVLAFIAAIPLLAAASSCCATEEGSGLKVVEDHAFTGKAHGIGSETMSADHSMHADHSTHGGLVEIGAAEVDGVKGVAKIKSYDHETIESMKKMGMNGTHHLMVFFSDAKSGAVINDGKVGFKATGSAGAEGKPLMLMLMGNGFGADIALEEGDYTFDVRIKLNDGSKRKFTFDFHNH